MTKGTWNFQQKVLERRLRCRWHSETQSEMHTVYDRDEWLTSCAKHLMKEKASFPSKRYHPIEPNCKHQVSGNLRQAQWPGNGRKTNTGRVSSKPLHKTVSSGNQGMWQRWRSRHYKLLIILVGIFLLALYSIVNENAFCMTESFKIHGD